MILDAFITEIRNAIYGDAITTGSHIAIGTGTTAVTAGDTALETEVGTREAATPSKPDSETAAFSAEWATGDANGLSPLTEVGVVTAASGGTFLNRKVFPGFEKTSSYSLRVQVYIKSENS